MLRLLEPDADFLSDKERHIQAEYKERQRPIRDVQQHIRKLSQGPRANKKSKRKKKICTKGAPPALTLEEVEKSVLVVDAQGEWMRGWKENFSSLRIENLRSLMNAHTVRNNSGDIIEHATEIFF